MSLKVHVVSIDQQNDFTNPNGSLYVKGAEENVKRGAKMLQRLRDKITEIHRTMDSHNKVDISHPLWWVTAAGQSPAPFTGVSLLPDDTFQFLNYATGATTTGQTRMLGAKKRTIKYLKDLKSNDRYGHTIWPNHCLIGDEGHNIDPIIAEAIHEWEEKRYAIANTITKGSNPWTEHFSAIKAEVPDPEDPSTQVNTKLIQEIEAADLVVWMGEALSHCLANTFRDTIANFSDPSFVKKQWICVNGSSSVPGFEKLGDDFLAEMKAKGVNLTTTEDFLA